MKFVFYIPFILVAIVTIIIFIIVIKTIVKGKNTIMDENFMNNLKDLGEQIKEESQSGKMKKCNYCGTENEPTAKKCSSCGAPINSKGPKE